MRLLDMDKTKQTEIALSIKNSLFVAQPWHKSWQEVEMMIMGRNMMRGSASPVAALALTRIEKHNK